MFSINKGTVLNAVRTRLDDVLYPEYDRESAPGEVRANSPVFFKQRTTDRGVISYSEYQPPALPESHDEEESVFEAQARLFNETSKTVINLKEDLPISQETFDDDIHGVVDESVRQSARKMRQKIDRQAFELTYGDGFSGA